MVDPSAGVTVVGVVLDSESGVVTRAFGSPVVAIADAVGLLCNGEEAGGFAATPGGALEATYADAPVVGDPWSLEFSYVDLTFAGGGTLQPGSGVIA